MKYMLLLYGEETGSQPPAGEQQAAMAEWVAYDAAVREAGVRVAGHALQPTPTATTVQVKGAERVVTDGPFAETREVLGGYYLLDVPDLDTALDWAARTPAAKSGSVEVRPVVVFDNLPG